MAPQSVRKQLEAQECNEKAFLTDKDHEGCKSDSKSSNSTKRKMVYFNAWIPKRHHTQKHCLLGKHHGGANMTHNSLKYQKFASNVNPNKNFKGKDAVDSLTDLRNLIKEGVATCNYPYNQEVTKVQWENEACSQDKAQASHQCIHSSLS